jgi:ribonuclease J
LTWALNVVHKGNAKVHVSGHAAAGELLYCYNIVKPRGRDARPRGSQPPSGKRDIAIKSRVFRSRTRVLVGENGTVFDLTDGVATRTGQLDIGFVYVDGSTVGEITEADLKDRRILAEEGFISIFIGHRRPNRRHHRRPRNTRQGLRAR